MKELSAGSSKHAPFELYMLTEMPCGCVASDFLSQALDVEFVSIEAKGPHCTLRSDASGAVLGLGEIRELDTSQLNDLAVTQPAA